MILDLFAGPGGWSEGLRMLGLSDIGLELDEAACRTRRAAGHLTIRADVTAYPTEPFIGKVCGLIASPPCPDFSLAGKRAGITGETGRLMWEVLRWTDALRPEWLACEQVPQALPYWQQWSVTLRGWGYRTWTGVLNTADYGVPQRRKRGLLLAHLGRHVEPPEPTHSESPGEGLWGSLLPHVTMAEAVGWGVDEPALTVSGGGAPGGWEPFPNASYRRRLARTVVDRRTNSKDGRGGMVPTVPVPVTRPAPTLTGKAITQWVIRTEGAVTNSANLTVREAAVLQSFRPDYPFQGNKGQQGQQIGNAVPPLFAAHVLSAVTGIELPKKAAA